MSVTIHKTFKVDGVLTNAASFTFGVIRTDNDAVVVPTGTALTRPSAGTYEYTFDEPASSLTYTITFICTYGGGSQEWSESVTGSVEHIAMPELTGDNLVDTFNALIVERLRVSRDGPKVEYNLHGHNVKWTAYLADLDRRIMALRREIAAAAPFEDVGICL
jgi:hypothetical protein